MVMRSRRLPRRPFHADSPRARGPVLPSLLLRRRCPVHDRAAAEEARGTPGCCAIGAARSGRVTAPPVDSDTARLRSAAGTSCSGATPLRPVLHTPPPRRSSAVAGGPRHRGGTAPSRFPLLLATGHSRSARAPTLPLTAGALLLGPSNLSAGPASSRAGGCPAMESGRGSLSSHLLIFFPLSLTRGRR